MLNNDDKNADIILMGGQSYIDKTLGFINNHNFIKLNKNPLPLKVNNDCTGYPVLR